MFILYEHIDTMQELSDEEFGLMMRALYQYERTGTAPEFQDRAMRMMWSSLRAFADQSYQNMLEKRRAKSEAGKKGNARRWGTRPEGTDAPQTPDAPDLSDSTDAADALNAPDPTDAPDEPGTPGSPALPVSQCVAGIADATDAIPCHRKDRLSESVSVSESDSVSDSVSVSSSSKEPAAPTTKTTRTLVKEFRANIGKLNEHGQAELSRYAERLGEDLVREIIRKCGDAGGRSWAYVRKALAEAERQGVRSAEEYRLTHPLGAGRNQRVDRQSPSGNDFLAHTDLALSLNRLQKRAG